MKIKEVAYNAFSKKAVWHLPGRTEASQKSSIWTAGIMSRMQIRLPVTEDKSHALSRKITFC
jgi:hypothetical protein